MGNEIKDTISSNITKYRKLNGLTQSQLANKINYSDKAVSKWERGESLPDILVLKQIANVLGVSISAIVEPTTSEENNKIIIDKKSRLNNKQKFLITIISYLVVWFIMTCVFVFLKLFTAINKLWLIYIYAIPLSSIVLIIFACVWHKGLFQLISLTIFIWSLSLSLYLTYALFSNIWLLFIICVPLQLLTIFWFLLRKTLVPKIKNFTFKRTKKSKTV